MSCFLGRLRFEKSVENLDSIKEDVLSDCEKRSTGDQWSLFASDVECVGVSRRAGDFYSSDDVTVMVDGSIDWLDENKDDTKRFISQPAKAIADLYREKKLDWLSRLQGSFALVICDRTQSTVHLVRDKLGTKPLYYALTTNGWTWGSRVGGIQMLLEKHQLNNQALSEVVHYRWLVGDVKLLDGVKQVLPCHVVTLDMDKQVRNHKYWSFSLQSSGGDLNAWVNRIDDTLNDYFSRMAKRYDSVGVLLSGGVDSSLLAAIASKHVKKIVAVTPKWSHGENPEIERALSFSKHLGIEHITPDVTDLDLKEKYREILRRTEEPCRYYHGMALLKALDAFPADVDAVLYGEAADTLFGSKVLDVALAFKKRRDLFKHIPSTLQGALEQWLPRELPGKIGRLKQYATTDYRAFCHRIHAMESSERPHLIFPNASKLPAPNLDMLERLMAGYDDPGQYVQAHMVFTSVISHLETIDKMGAGHSFDLLHPFISNEMLKAAEEFPQSLQILDGATKPVLRELASRYYPREWIYEKKIGFRVPTLNWLKGPLREEMKILDEPLTRSRGVIACNRLLRLPLENNFELYYTAMGLERVMRQFNLDV